MGVGSFAAGFYGGVPRRFLKRFYNATSLATPVAASTTAWIAATPLVAPIAPETLHPGDLIRIVEATMFVFDGASSGKLLGAYGFQGVAMSPSLTLVSAETLPLTATAAGILLSSAGGLTMSLKDRFYLQSDTSEFGTALAISLTGKALVVNTDAGGPHSATVNLTALWELYREVQVNP